MIVEAALQEDDEDIPAIKALGIQGCFGPGTSTESIILFVREHIQVERGKMPLFCCPSWL